MPVLATPRPPATFGGIIRARRRSLGLDQLAVAKAIGCSRATVQKIEVGAGVHPPRPELLCNLARVLDIAPEVLAVSIYANREK